MRQLLITAVGILFAGPAMAVDYVKCEAMQKAYDRALATRKAISFEVMKEVSRRDLKKACGEDPSSSCMAEHYRASRDQQVREILSDPRVKPYRAKVLMIEADLKKAGCP
jgi:hypothetical protein